MIEITTDSARIDLDRLHEWLKTSYWAANRSKETQAQAIASSLNFAAIVDGRMVGYARIVTDHHTFAWLCDVFVDEHHRGHGIGRALMEAVVGHPDLANIRRIVLGTKDAHWLYSKYGFEEPEPGRFMVRRGSDAPATDP